MNGDIIAKIEERYKNIIYPRLVKEGFHIKAAKWGERYSEQSLLTHILNAVFSILRLFSYFEELGLRFPEDFMENSVAYITLHDILKAENETREKHTDVVLDTVNQWVEKLSLKEFATHLDEKDARAVIAAHMKWSQHKTAILTSDIDIKLLAFVKLADYLASMEKPENYSRVEAILRQVNEDLGLTYHKVGDIRGYTTGCIHSALMEILAAKYALTPLLYFPSGILYIGRLSKIEILRSDLKEISLTSEVLQKIRVQLEKTIRSDDAPTAIILEKMVNPPTAGSFIDWTVFLFFSIDRVVDEASAICINNYGKKKQKWTGKSPSDYSKEIEKKTHGDIQISLNEEAAMLAPFLRVIRSIINRCVPSLGSIGATCFLAKKLGIALSNDLVESMRKYSMHIATAAAFDDCRILAAKYIEKYGPSTNFQFGKLIDQVKETCKEVLTEYRTSKYTNRLLGTELRRFWDELDAYTLHTLSLDGKTLSLDLKTTKRIETFKSHALTSGTSYCPICNRVTKGILQRKDIACLSPRVFSNREAPWSRKLMKKICAPCCTEFLLRSLSYPNQQRDEACYLFLFIFPQYSFTPALQEKLDRELRYLLDEPECGFNNIQAARLILTDGLFNPLKLEDFGKVLGKGQSVLRPKIVTRFLPGLFFVIWQIPRAPEDVTQIEKWYLATFFALLIQQTLDVKVLVTQSIYPELRNSDEISGMIKLSAPHQWVRDIFGENIGLDDIEKHSLLAAAIWYCHINTNAPHGKIPDSGRVAIVLKTLTSKMFPGSVLAARYVRLMESGGRPPFITDLIRKSCETLDKWKTF